MPIRSAIFLSSSLSSRRLFPAAPNDPQLDLKARDASRGAIGIGDGSGDYLGTITIDERGGSVTFGPVTSASDNRSWPAAGMPPTAAV